MINQIKTPVQCVIYLFTLVNSFLAMFGTALPFSESEVYTVCSVLALAVVFSYGIWKNFNTSDEAKLSQKLLDALKAGTVSADAVQAVLKEQEAV